MTQPYNPDAGPPASYVMPEQTQLYSDFTGTERKCPIRIWFFTPREIYPHVARAFLYNPESQFFQYFSDPNGEDLTTWTRDPMHRQEVGKAIMPSNNGTLMDTSALMTYWSFIMMIDHDALTLAGNPANRFSPSMVTFMSGHVLDEPVNPLTMSENPNAVLIPTHVTQFAKSPMMASMNGMTGGGFSIRANLDMLSRDVTQQMTPYQLYCAQPTDLLNCMTPLAQPYEPVVPYDQSTAVPPSIDPYIAQLKVQSPSATDPTLRINSVNSVPVAQICSLAKAADDATRDVSTESAWRSNLIDPSPLMNLDDFSNSTTFDVGFQTSINQMRAPQILNGLSDFQNATPITMGSLKAKYDDAIEVRMFRVPPSAMYDVRDQQNADAKTQFSSMITMVVAAVMSELGVSQITFGYVSDALDPYTMTRGTFIWDARTVGFFCPITSPSQVKTMVDQFLQTVRREVLDPVQYFVEDFSVNVSASGTGALLVDLRFKSDRDYGGLTPNYSETLYNVMPYMSPMMMKADEAQYNLNMLSNFRSNQRERAMTPGVQPIPLENLVPTELTMEQQQAPGSFTQFQPV